MRGQEIVCSTQMIHWNIVIKTLRSYFNGLKMNEAAGKQAASFQSIDKHDSAADCQQSVPYFFSSIIRVFVIIISCSPQSQVRKCQPALFAAAICTLVEPGVLCLPCYVEQL